MAQGQTSSAIRVRTRFDSLEKFTDEYGPLFDPKGLFIRTRHMYPIGTSVRFELQLATGQSVFRGEGRVDQIGSSTPGHAGFHVRLTKLDRESKALFDSIVERTALEQSGVPQFETDPHRTPTLPSMDAFADYPFSSGPTLDARPLIDLELLSHDVLEQIADGIEGTLDSLLRGEPVDPALSAQLAATPGSGPAPEALLEFEPEEDVPTTDEIPVLAAEKQAPFPATLTAESFEEALVEPEPEEDEPNTDEIPVYPAEQPASAPVLAAEPVAETLWEPEPNADESPTFGPEPPIPAGPVPVWSPPIEQELTPHTPKNTDEELAAFMQDLNEHPNLSAGVASQPGFESAQPAIEYDPVLYDAPTIGPDAGVFGEYDLPGDSPDASFLGDPALAMASNVMGDSGELLVLGAEPIHFSPETMEADDSFGPIDEPAEFEILMEPVSAADLALSSQDEVYELDEVSLVGYSEEPQSEPEVNFEMIGPPTLKQSELVSDVSDGLSLDIQQDWYAEQEHHRFVTTEDSAELGDLIADLVSDDSSLGKHEPPFPDHLSESPFQQPFDETGPQLATLTHQADHTAASSAKAVHQKQAQRGELMKEARLLMDQVDAGSATPSAGSEKKGGLFNRVFGRKKKT